MLAKSRLSDLFTQYSSELSSYLSNKFGLGGDAEDVVQDTFYNLISTDCLKDVENPRAYLYQAARNLAISRLRRQGYYDDYISSVSGVDVASVMLEREVMAKLDLQSVQVTLDKLPEKYRKTFVLHRVEGKSYKQISEEMNVSVSTVEKRIMKVLYHLRCSIDEG